MNSERSLEQVVYYPDFEVQDETWLKFSLLYMDKLMPIIPHDARSSLSDRFRKLETETDLLQPHQPEGNYEYGRKASSDAVEEIERILRAPQRFEHCFRSRDFVGRWKTPSTWTVDLYHKKFRNIFSDFLLGQRLARLSDNGVKMHPELASVYMTILAHVIADRSKLPAMTDFQELDDVAMALRQAPPASGTTATVGKVQIELLIPQLQYVPLDKVIKFRKKSGTSEQRQALHAYLKERLELFEQGQIPGVITIPGNILTDLSDELISSGVGTVNMGISCWALINSAPEATNEPVQFLGAASALAVASTISIRKAWKHTKTTRLSRKYVARLRGLNDSR